MAAKVKINEYGDCLYNEDHVIDLIYQNPDLDISKLFLDNIEKYNQALEEIGIQLPPLCVLPTNRNNVKEFDLVNIKSWFMPQKYQTINIEEYLLEKCNNELEKSRVKEEMTLFRDRGFELVLQFLVYFVDTLRNNNIVWGVGRGSSVSSFCLFLIGVHKINPLLYDLDHKEFLR